MRKSQTTSIKTDESIALLTSQAIAAIQYLSTELSGIRARAGSLAKAIEQDRMRVQQEREERDLLHSLDLGREEVEDAPNSSELLGAEEQMLARISELTTFEDGLSDFASVLAAATDQIQSAYNFPNSTIAAELVTRMATMRAREDERQRFARDIHDGPAQAFANAIIGLEFLERALRSGRDSMVDDALAEIDRIKTSMREGLTEIRRFIFDNRPTMLRDRGLAATVRHYVHSYQSIFPLVVRVDIDDTISIPDADIELTAFRVIQESIQNASRHARATQVDVAIQRTGNDETIVTVVDNGRGFDPARVSTHAMGGSGLKGMEERASLVGGKLEVQSERGEGTTIRLWLPSTAI